jgi:hypothetical protein
MPTESSDLPDEALQLQREIDELNKMLGDADREQAKEISTLLRKAKARLAEFFPAAPEPLDP